MDTPPATHKVAFVLFGIILMLLGTLVLLQQPASAGQSPPFIADNKPFTPDGKNIYVLRSGQSYNIFNKETVDTCFGGSSNVQRFDSAFAYLILARYHYNGIIGCPVNYPDNTLLKIDGQSETYIKTNDKLYVVPSPEILTKCLGQWDTVHVISSIKMSWVLNTYRYSGVYACQNRQYVEGTLLQASGPGVYLISGKKRLGIPNPTVLDCFGGWGQVTHVTDSEFNQMISGYPDGGVAACPYSLANGSKLAYNGTVFVLRNGRLYGMPNPETLVGCYGGWSGVRVIDATEFNQAIALYPYAGAGSCPYSLPNGSKVLAPSGTVLIVSGGLTFGMPSAEVLNTCYGGWANVRSVSQDEVNLIVSVYPYAGAAQCVLPQAGAREQRAVDWVKSQIGTTAYNGWCELFVENAYGTHGRYASAVAQANSKIARGLMHSGDTNVPAGAIAYFGSATVNGGYGHVIVSIGGGQFVSTGYSYNGHTYGAYVTGLNPSYMGPYMGWAWADEGWSR